MRAEEISRPLAAHFVQQPRRHHPGMRAGPRVARLFDAAARREPWNRRGGRASFTREVGYLPCVPHEEILFLVDLPVAARERHVVVFGALEHAAEAAVEVRPPYDDVVIQVVLQRFGGLEEMELVFDDRPADRTTELMAAEVRLLLSSGLGERVDRIHRLVAIELKTFAMDLVRAALGRHRHGAARRPPVFGRRLAQIHLELLDAGLWEVLSWLPRVPFLVPDAVDEQRGSVGECAG